MDMVSMTLMEEALQQSVATSDEDAEFEEDNEMDVSIQKENADSFAANKQLLNGVSGHRSETGEDEEEEDDDEEDDDDGEDEDEDGEGDEDDDEEEGSSESDEEAEGEDDEEAAEENAATSGQDEDAEGESDDADGEGVGAVKIQPGLLVDDDDDDDDASAQDDVDDESDASVEITSKESSEAESEVGAEWEAVAEDEEEGSEPVNPNRCIFCQQDEDNDPSADFEEYLACSVCGDNSHRQCARDADALISEEGAEQWRCPGCVANALEPEAAMADASASLSARRSSAPKLARDLLPSQRGSIKPDSHSVFNHLIVDNDPMDGSRILRKRKTSSAEAEDHNISPLRKRRKNGSDGSSHVVIVESISPEVKEEKRAVVQLGGIVEHETVRPPTPRPSRSLRLKAIGPPRASIIQRGAKKIVICLRIDAADMVNITSRAPKPKKPPRIRSRNGVSTTLVTPTYIPQSYSHPFYSFHDKENDELKSKPYGGILTEAEADTSKTLPQPDDRRRFDDARQRAEEEWKLKTAAALADSEIIKRPRKVSGPASQIESISFGGYEIDTWYAAPYPEEYSRNRVLHICEFCLKYMTSEYVAWRHKLKCQAKHPPGDEIYRDGSIAVFEVDGRKNPVYCQNLCLLAKLFLGSKTLYYDVEPFLFYVMTEFDELGCHFVGYFSKEKRPSSQNNVSCILTLPIHQRKGYGNLLIDFSYLLTRVERKSGSPEKPLSDMGLVSYRNYWRLVLCYYLRDQKSPVSIIEISERTGMTADDIVSALEGLRALVRDPITATYALRLDYEYYQEYIQKWENKKYVKLNPKGLVWTPYIMGRNNAAMIEHGPPLNAIAPRDGEDDDTKPIIGSKMSTANGSSQHSASGTLSGDGDHPDSHHDPMEIDELSLDSAPSSGQFANGTENGKGVAVPVETPSEIPETSPSTRRLIKQAMSGSPSRNGIASRTPSTLVIPPTTIPPTRFEIYPPVPGVRWVARPRPSGSVSRPPPGSRSAVPTSVSRPSHKRRSSGGSSRRSTNSRSRRSTRRRSGGTGRGPGRWPKGTKKSDFGNADSGPGLPPRVAKQRSRLGMELTLESGDEEDEEEDIKASMSLDEEEDDEDAILYETPGPTRRRDRENGQGQGKGNGLGKGIGKDFVEKEEDEEEEEDVYDVEPYELVTGDVDAEGEDE